ncbi:Glucose-responsive transcription factor [Saitoella coloradoensis]
MENRPPPILPPLGSGQSPSSLGAPSVDPTTNHFSFGSIRSLHSLPPPVPHASVSPVPHSSVPVITPNIASAPRFNSSSPPTNHHQQQQQQQPPMLPSFSYQSPLPQSSLESRHRSHSNPHQQGPGGPIYPPRQTSPRAPGTSDTPEGPKKRHKISRACDECRRKKIRCDASTENTHADCTSCRRSGIKCSFSRVPMKRGPSKGYIKELEDRLGALEHYKGSDTPGQLSGGPNGSGNISRSVSPPQGAGLQGVPVRKRPLSADHIDFQPWSGSGQVESGSNYSTPPVVSYDRTLPPIESLRNAAAGGQRETLEFRNGYQPFGATLKPADTKLGTSQIRLPYPEPGTPHDSFWDEAAIDKYYTNIHHCFPLLPHSKQRLRLRLASAPASAREALLYAIYALVRPTPADPNMSPKSGHGQGDTLSCRATNLLSLSAYDRSVSGNLEGQVLVLAALVLMAIEADHRGPPGMLGGGKGFPVGVWLGSAVGMAYQLKLHLSRKSTPADISCDIDGDEQLARRAWWVIVVLDRWHAVSTCSPPFIPDANVNLSAEDYLLLGMIPYHLTRVSCILGHLADAFSSPDESISSSSNPYISKILRGELERFRESVEVVWGQSNLLHIAYWHVKLLALLHTSTSEPHTLLGPALRIASILQSPSTPVTPLNHHFAALSGSVLLRLANIPETRDDSLRGLFGLREAIERRRGLIGREGMSGWDAAIRDLVTKVSLRGSLGQLADVAIGDAKGLELSTSGNAGLDATLRKHGYLSLAG